MLSATATTAPNSALDPQTGVVHDADMLQAAQLLLPGDYRTTGMCPIIGHGLFFLNCAV